MSPVLAPRLRTFVVVVMAIALPALPARADDAAVYQQKATAAFGLGEYREAAENFERAYKFHPDPALLYNAAQAHRMGGDKDRALALYENYLHVYGKRDSRADEVQRHIDDLKAAIARDKSTATSPSPTTSSVNSAPPPPTPPMPSAPPPAPTTGAPPATPPTPGGPPPLTAAPPRGATEPLLVAQPAPKSSDDRPATHKAWFWVAIGGAVVVAAATAILIANRGSTKDPTASLGTVDGYPQ